MFDRILRENVQDILPLTPIQTSMLYPMLINPSGSLYHEQQRYTLKNLKREDLIEAAWNMVAENNDVLRTVFRWNKLSKPVQIVLKEKKIPIKILDFCNKPNSEHCSDKVNDALWREKVDITKHTFQVVLCKIAPTVYDMIICSHHIILDGWSNALLLNEFRSVYTSLCKREPVALKKAGSYRNYVLWLIKQYDNKSSIAGWKEYLKGYDFEGITKISNTYNLQNKKKETYAYRFRPEFKSKLENLSKEYAITPASIFYSVWGIVMLYRTKKKDILFGVTVSGRNIPIAGIEELVAVCIKTLPLRIKIEKRMCLLELIQRVGRDIINMEEVQNVYHSDILPYDKNAISSVVVIQNYPIDASLCSDSREELLIDLKSSNYDINIDIVLGIKLFPNYTELEFSYDGYRYTMKQIQALCQNFTDIMERLMRNMRYPIRRFITLIDRKDKKEGLDEIF